MTVHDPASAQSADVLDGGPDEQPHPGRWLVVAVLLVAVVGLVAGGRELLERRAAAAEERRLRAAVEVVLLEDRGATVSSAPQGYLLQAELRLRNDGPRRVEVSGGSWAGLALVRPVQLPSGGDRQVALGLEVACGADRPAPLAVDDDVELQVTTASTVRTVRLPVPDPPLDVAEAQRLCGFFPLEERLLLLRQEQARVGASLVLEVDLSVAGRAPVEVLTADAGPGLAAVVRGGTDGATVQLPVTLPAADDGPPPALTYEVVVTVTDCAAARAATDTAGLSVRTGDEQGRTTETLLPYERALHTELLADRCPR